MKKKLLNLKGTALLALMSLVCTLNVSAYDFEDYSCHLYFNFLNDGEVSLTYYDSNYNSYSGFVYIPTEAEAGVLHPVLYPVTEVGEYAFRNCTNLTGVSFGDEVKVIGFDSFWNCTSLQELNIPDNVTKISNWAFENCSSLSKVVIGSGMTSIGSSAFYGCSALRTIICNATTPPSISSSTFPSTVLSYATLIVPASALNAYKNANYWKEFSNITTAVYINSTNFPDENFRKYMLNLYPNGYITQAEINALTSLNVSYENISNMKGVELLTALKELRCYNNPLTSLDVNSNTELTYLDCAPTSSYTGPKLTTLNLSQCTKLETLYCYNTNITSLSLGNLSKLRRLECYNTKLVSLSVTYKPQLTILNCRNNTSMKSLSCYSCDLTTLEVTGCTALTDLRCYYNYNLATVTGLRDCKAITYLDCEDCAISDLSAVSVMTNIERLYCRNNQITFLNVCDKPNLVYLRASGNQSLDYADVYSNKSLATLDMSNCPNLARLFGMSNAISTLSLSGCNAMEVLNLHGNKLTSLDVSNFPKLVELACGSNLLTSIDISHNPKLEELICSNAQITTLDLSHNPLLRQLNCADGQLTSINVQGCTQLQYIWAEKNHISGAGMWTLVNSLPTRPSNSHSELRIIQQLGEYNVITSAQVAVALAKNWDPLRETDDGWEIIPVSTPGDMDGDGKVAIGDVTDLIDLLLNGNAGGNAAADVDGDGTVGISDVTALIDLLLSGNL